MERPKQDQQLSLSSKESTNDDDDDSRLYQNHQNLVVVPTKQPVHDSVPRAMPKKQERVTPQWKEAVAGACSGAVSRTVMAPVERIKLLKQLQGSIHLSTKEIAVEEAAAATTTTKTNHATLLQQIITTNVPLLQKNKYSTLSAWEMTKIVYKEQGLLSFWRGNIPNVIRVSGGAAINFTCMDYYKNAAVTPWLEHNFLIQRQYTKNIHVREDIERKRKLLSSFVSGGLAGATTTTILYPIEFMRTRLALDVGGSTIFQQQQQHKYQREFTGMRDFVQRIFKSDGIFGFYQGYGIALVGGVFYRLVLLGGYDALKNEVVFQKVRKKRNNETKTKPSYSSSSSSIKDTTTATTTKLSLIERILSAQFVSVVAGTASYPFDSVRRRMMMQSGVDSSQRQYTNSFHCIRLVLREEGIRGFYLGLGPNIVRSIGGALLLVGYDGVRNSL